MKDVTFGENDLDSNIFTFDEVDGNGKSTLTIDSNVNNVSAAYVYTLEYRVKLEALGDKVSTYRQFKVELKDPCISSTLTIDDSVFKPETEVSLTQYVEYEKLSLIWTDSIVTSSVAVSNICGSLTYELHDFSSRIREQINEDIFKDIDLLSMTKELKC